MKYKMKQKLILVIFVIVSVHTIQGAHQYNQLNKVFHHFVTINEEERTNLPLELGKVVFYFSRDPIVNERTKKIDDKHAATKAVFFFPTIDVKSAECKQMIKRLNKIQSPSYTIKVVIVEKPEKGISLIITYNAERVDFSYSSFESIGLQKGIVFTFYNKALINQLKNANSTILRTACNNRRPGVVIDAGHGGSDHGAIGYFNLKEKDISLEIGLQLAQLLRQEGFDVFLTRDTDTERLLDQRTMHAHSSKADILVSIHANYACNNCASGIETFCLDTSLLKKKFSTLHGQDDQIVSHIIHANYRKSNTLAHFLQQETVGLIRKKKIAVVNRQVKHAVSQVLLGTTIPAVLIELGFLSNKQEAALLKNKHYQTLLAQGICNGIISYFN